MNGLNTVEYRRNIIKQVRKLLAIVLSIAIVIGLIPVANGKTNTKAAETFAITTPYDNALVASGHFDIKWSDATAKTVKSKKLVNKKKFYVRARGIAVVNKRERKVNSKLLSLFLFILYK